MEMSILQVHRIVLIGLLLPMFLFPGCESKDIAPFKNGDYFEYQLLNKGYLKRYQIESNEEGRLKITWRTGVDSEPVELIVDQTGKIVETPTYPKGSLGHDLFYGRQITLWLPKNKRTIGEHVYFADFIDKNIVIEEREWKRWSVWVTKHSNVFGWQENYFDKRTGFFVGSDSAGDVYVLKDSNYEL